VSLVNWRGVMAPPGIRDADLKALSAAMDKMVQSPAWKETLKTRGWIDLYQPAAEFKTFLEKDRAQVEGILKDVGLVK
jgi:putative tricarboxylic transport membrane protein